MQNIHRKQCKSVFRDLSAIRILTSDILIYEIILQIRFYVLLYLKRHLSIRIQIQIFFVLFFSFFYFNSKQYIIWKETNVLYSRIVFGFIVNLNSCRQNSSHGSIKVFFMFDYIVGPRICFSDRR